MSTDSSTVIRGGSVLDSQSGALEPMDVWIREGRIEAVWPTRQSGPPEAAAAPSIDAQGGWVAPGFVDVVTQLGEPGLEWKETISSAAAAAAAGGFSLICTHPDTNPINDIRSVTEQIVSLASAARGSKVVPVGAATAGMRGETLADIGEMLEAGAVALATGGARMQSAQMLRRVMEYTRTFGAPLISAPCESTLSSGGVVHEGTWSTRRGLEPVPEAAETIAVFRDIELAAATSARVIIGPLSCARSVELVARAKERGLDVFAMTSIHHLALTDAAIANFDSRAKIMPPLRSEADRRALIGGINDGTIDILTSAHIPQTDAEKEMEFDRAEFGAMGLEALAPLLAELVRADEVRPSRALQALTTGPRAALGLPAVSVAPGATADLTIVDPEVEWTIEAKTLRTRATNTVLWGRTVRGRALATWADGKRVHGYS